MGIHDGESMKDELHALNDAHRSLETVDPFALITEEEKQKLLYDWNDTTRPYPRNKTIQQLFEEQVVLYPAKIAIRHDEQSITYLALNEKANQLARLLRAKQADLGRFIAVCMDKRVDAIVAMLAILKTGRAYLPIDPEYPLERIHFMLKDSAARVVLTSKEHLNTLQNVQQDGVECIDVCSDVAEGFSDENVSRDDQSATDLAYLMYTSGSTGVPKGVLIPHRGVVRLVRNQNYIDIKPEHVFAQGTNFVFDVMVFEIWGALLNGAELVLVEKSVLLHPIKFSKLISDNKVTVLWLTPSIYNQIFNFQPATFGCLDYLIVGGEALSPTVMLRQFQAVPRPKHIINEYGPTEVSVFATCYDIVDSLGIEHSVPIGPPITNTQCYVLDERLRMLPVGEVGELFLAGDGVAYGYLNREIETRERFFEVSFLDETPKRLYKTGDLARWRSDGVLEFIGRKDNQIKFQGVRVEIDELELAIRSIGAVREAAVVPVKKEERVAYLPAFVVFFDGYTLSSDELRAALSAILPGDMQPTAFVIKESLPTNANGKIDRPKLLNAFIDEQDVCGETKSVFHCLSELVLHVYRAVLKAPSASLDSDYFDLGGNSLIAMQMIAMFYQFGLNLEVLDILSHPKISEVLLCLHAKGYVQRYIYRKSVRAENDPGKYRIESCEHKQLSPSQTGMMYHILSNEIATQYLVQVYFEIKERVSAPLMVSAWQRLVERHDMLHSGFIYNGIDLPYRVVNDKAEFQFDYHDFSATDKPVLQKLNEFLMRDRAQGVLLDASDAFRVSLLKFEEARYVMVFVHSHLVLDGWAINVLLKEFFIVYEALVEDRFFCLPSSASYHSLVSWIDKQPEKPAKLFWEKQCNVFPCDAQLPKKQGHSVNTSYQCRRLIKHFSIERSAQLRCFIRRHKLTIASVFQSLWAIALSKQMACSQVVYGLIASLLPKEVQDINAMIGPVMNVVPFYVSLKNDESMIEFIKRVQEKTSEILSFAHYPLYKIKSQIQGLGKGEIFEALFAVENYSSYPETNLSIGRVNVYDTNHYPLALQIFPDAQIGMELVFNKCLFSRGQIKQIMSSLVFLLNALLEGKHAYFEDALNAHRPLKQFLSFGNERCSYKFNFQFKSIVALFEKQVHRRKNACALKCKDDTLSYGDLNQQANRLANYLIRLGLVKGDVVAIFADRTMNTVVYILAVMKAGAAYVPIDARYPKSRVDYIIKDSGASFFLIDRSERADFYVDWDGVILFSEDMVNELALESPMNPFVSIAPADLAYLIYTSGSTGVPKGVLVEHKNIVSLFAASHKHFKFNHRDVWTLFHSSAFDVSVWEMWGCLLYGGKLVIATDACIASATIFYQLLVSEKVTVLSQTPSFFNLLVQVDSEEKKRLFLRLIILAGEALRFSDVGKWYQSHDDDFPQVINMYGLTEATVHSAYKRLNRNIVATNHRELIGRPLMNSCFIVFDEQYNLVHTGGVGELFVGGERLSRGYLNRERLTEESYIKHPTYGRLYKTGDLVRVLSDSELEYIGRNDFQIKLHGFRIELGELEAAVLSFKGIRQAVIMLRGEGENAYLVAYVTTSSKNNDALDVQQLREYLFSCLPSYMVPALYVLLDELPMTINGKIDRKKLENNQKEFLGEANVLLTEQESMVVGIYAQVLNVADDEISPTADFFEMGGNSLLVMMVVNLLRQQVNFPLTIKGFVEHSSPRQLCAHIARNVQ